MVDEGRADSEVAAAIDGELRLLEPEVRRSAVLAGELLDPEFTEVGSSGQRWGREEMLVALPELTTSTGEDTCLVRDMTGTRLAPGLVQLTFETVIGGRLARRTSLWRNNPGVGWQMYYHQATPVPTPTEA